MGLHGSAEPRLGLHALGLLRGDPHGGDPWLWVSMGGPTAASNDFFFFNLKTFCYFHTFKGYLSIFTHLTIIDISRVFHSSTKSPNNRGLSEKG